MKTFARLAYENVSDHVSRYLNPSEPSEYHYVKQMMYVTGLSHPYIIYFTKNWNKLPHLSRMKIYFHEISIKIQ